MRFDSTDPLPAHLNPEAAMHDVKSSIHSKKENPFQFEIAVHGSRCLPSLGQVAIKYLTLNCQATIWWDVFARRMSIASICGMCWPPNRDGSATRW